MPALTATIISFNEELDLPRTLASLRGIADEIVVVDSESTDRTVEIAEASGARVYSRKLDNFAEQKNYASSLSSNDWILCIDCDEELSPELRSAILAWKRESPSKNVYEILRLTNYLGAWIRHSGWYPEFKTLLFHREKAKFVGALHERVQAEGPSGRLNGQLFHYTIRSLAEHDAKLDAMSTLAAEEMFARGRKSWRAAMILVPPWTIAQRLVFRLGFLDGRRGWLIAWMSAKYVYVKFRKLGRLLCGEKVARRAWPTPGGA
jgi:cellulose synthase/poly-beta-1,6-N-acetylglucosamine synthase-like glycosyltransferase